MFSKKRKSEDEKILNFLSGISENARQGSESKPTTQNTKSEAPQLVSPEVFETLKNPQAEERVPQPEQFKSLTKKVLAEKALKSSPLRVEEPRTGVESKKPATNAGMRVKIKADRAPKGRRTVEEFLSSVTKAEAEAPSAKATPQPVEKSTPEAPIPAVEEFKAAPKEEDDKRTDLPDGIQGGVVEVLPTREELLKKYNIRVPKDAEIDSLILDVLGDTEFCSEGSDAPTAVKSEAAVESKASETSAPQQSPDAPQEQESKPSPEDLFPFLRGDGVTAVAAVSDQGDSGDLTSAPDTPKEAATKEKEEAKEDELKKKKKDWRERLSEKLGEYGLKFYSLIPRLGVPTDYKSLRGILGNFTAIVETYPDGQIKLYCVTSAPKETLSTFFEVYEEMPEPRKYVGVVTPKSSKLSNLYVDVTISDFASIGSEDIFHEDNLQNVLRTVAGYCVSVVEDPWLFNTLMRKGKAMSKKNPHTPEIKLLEKKLEEVPVRLKILLFADTEEELQMLHATLKSRINVGTDYKVHRVDNELEFYLAMLPVPLSGVEKVKANLSPGRVLTSTVKCLENTLSLPHPKVHPIGFVAGRKLPVSKTLLQTENAFRVGVDSTGTPVYLSPKDFYTHAYVLGRTGSGKSNLLKVIVKGLHEKGMPVIVIDPHGQLAEELAGTIPDSVYLHPLESPFAVNPLDLPPDLDKEQAKLLVVDVLLNLFTNVFHLSEQAVNVRYILQMVLRWAYNISERPPNLAQVYRVITALYSGVDLGIDDESFLEHVKIFRNMPDQSFISALGRLQSFYEDAILKRLTSTTTVPFSEFIEDRKLVLISLPKSDIGELGSTLLSSTILMKLYYEALTRRKSGKRKPFFVVIDEFQVLQSLPILGQILSEARKFGLHLVVSHQYTKQLTPEILQAVLNNSGLKFVFAVEGGDVEIAKDLDATLAEDLAKTITTLETGECLMKHTGNPPCLVKIDEYPLAPSSELMEKAKTSKYAPSSSSEELALLNWVFAYIDPPFPPKQRLLWHLYQNGKELPLNELAKAVPHIRAQGFEKIVATLESDGYINVVQSGKQKTAILTKKFFDEFRKIAPSATGGDIAVKAAIYYLSNNYYVGVVKNNPIDRPDFVALPYVDRTRVDLKRPVAVEIEAHLDRNETRVTRILEKLQMFKHTFSEVHVWIPKVHARKFAGLVPKSLGVKVFIVDENSLEVKTVQELVESYIPTEGVATVVATPEADEVDSAIKVIATLSKLSDVYRDPRVVKALTNNFELAKLLLRYSVKSKELVEAILNREELQNEVAVKTLIAAPPELAKQLLELKCRNLPLVLRVAKTFNLWTHVDEIARVVERGEKNVESFLNEVQNTGASLTPRVALAVLGLLERGYTPTAGDVRTLKSLPEGEAMELLALISGAISETSTATKGAATRDERGDDVEREKSEEKEVVASPVAFGVEAEVSKKEGRRKEKKKGKASEGKKTEHIEKVDVGAKTAESETQARLEVLEDGTAPSVVLGGEENPAKVDGKRVHYRNATFFVLSGDPTRLARALEAKNLEVTTDKGETISLELVERLKPKTALTIVERSSGQRWTVMLY